MAGLLNDVFGDPVTITPVNGASYELQAVFRREPLEVAGDDGVPVLILNPTLKVPEATKLSREDLVEPSIEPGKRYEVQSGEPSPSPAGDRFVFYELELVP